jgi:flagellar basal-body rod protein FlgC
MSLFSAIQVSASGMSAQRIRAGVLVENMANAETTRTPEGGPYHRKDVVFSTEIQSSPFSAAFQSELGVGVKVADVVTDPRDPEKRFMPGHPDADENGYVAFPRMNPAEEMVDLLSASRSFQANVSAMTAIKDMITNSIAIMK